MLNYVLTVSRICHVFVSGSNNVSSSVSSTWIQRGLVPFYLSFKCYLFILHDNPVPMFDYAAIWCSL
jgi:hypothetical protein